MDLTYGSATVEGYDSLDTFYLDSASTFGVTDFEFMLITYQEGISPSGGIMGFVRNFDYTDGTTPGPLLYEYLYSQG